MKHSSSSHAHREVARRERQAAKHRRKQEKRKHGQKGLGRLAARNASVFQLLIEVRNLLKPLTVLEAPSIVSRIEEEVLHTPELALSR
jgi:hypothetical protein